MIAVLNILTGSKEFLLRNRFSIEFSIKIVHKLRQLRDVDARKDEGCFGLFPGSSVEILRTNYKKQERYCH